MPAMLKDGAKKLQTAVEARARHIHRWTEVLLPFLVLATALVVRKADWDLVAEAKFKVFDTYQRMAPRVWDPALPVRIVDLDEETLRRKGQWPWPRTLVADLLRASCRGAGVVVFDSIFPEADRTSPPALAASLPPSAAEARALLSKLPDHDRAFARAIGEVQAGGCQVVTAFALTNGDSGRSTQAKRPVLSRGESPESFLIGYKDVTPTLPVIEKAAVGNGSMNNVPDVDGVARKAVLMFSLRGKPVPSLAAEAVRLAQEGGDKAVYMLRATGQGESTGGAETGLTMVKVGALNVPVDSNAGVLIHFTPAETPRSVPAWEVMSKDFDPARLGGGIVFIGTSAEGLKDQRPTPMSSMAPGVEIHAAVAEQMLSGHFLERPDYAEGMELTFILVLGSALILLMGRFGAAWCAVLAAAAIGAFSWGSWLAFLGRFGGRRMLFDPVLPSLVVLAVYMFASLLRYLRSEAEKRQVRGAFSRYMSPDLVEQLAKDPTRLKLGGEMREMTLMFSDIRGFTTISEQFDAHGLTTFINKYLTPMTQIVLDHKGTIDKYMGDCIMAFWNAPLDVPGHEVLACRGALKMIRRMNELNDQWKAEAEAEGRKFIPVRSGIGLNSGPCCVGNMGSDMRFDYSVLGDDVNLASRLEGQSKGYGVDIVIGAKTRAAASALAALELDLIKVKGKTVPVHIYTLQGDEALARDPRFKALAEKHAGMLAAYRGQRWDETDRLRGGCEKESEALGLHLPKLYHLYEERVAACRAEPPAPDWDGVFTATSK
jgi:adenylate cyclase